MLLKASTLMLVVTLFALAGCGGSSKSSSSIATPPASSTPAAAPATTTQPAPTSAPPLALASDPSGQLKFDTSTLTAKAGRVSIKFTNGSPVPHNLTIESSSGQTLGATPTFSGGSKMLSATLRPGIYTFFCAVPGHRAAGMSGMLTVQ